MLIVAHISFIVYLLSFVVFLLFVVFLKTHAEPNPLFFEANLTLISFVARSNFAWTGALVWWGLEETRVQEVVGTHHRQNVLPFATPKLPRGANSFSVSYNASKF